MSDSKPEKTKELCAGCYNNEYNYGLGGANECWEYKEAKIIKRLCVHISQSPPYNFKENSRWKLNCFRKPQFVYVNEGVLDKEGYWK